MSNKFRLHGKWLSILTLAILCLSAGLGKMFFHQIISEKKQNYTNLHNDVNNLKSELKNIKDKCGIP